MSELSQSQGSVTTEFKHTSVMLDECLSYLDVKPDDIFLDATLGGAGHSLQVIKKLGPDGYLLGIDQDEVALTAAQERLNAQSGPQGPHVAVLRGNFGDMDELLLEAAIPHLDAVLFDLGVSSVQIDTPSRGFSFKEEAPLDMRMNPGKQTLTAQEIVNTYSAADLTRIISDYSEEKWAKRIAEFIVAARQELPLVSSAQLVDVIKAAIPASARRAGGHPAKRTFQALRIEVNSELTVLRQGLEAAIRWLAPGGRIVVLSYHSLEDRIVKEIFKAHEKRCTCPSDLPVCVCGNEAVLKVLTRKAIGPSAQEVERNARARSAKLRAAKRL